MEDFGILGIFCNFAKYKLTYIMNRCITNLAVFLLGGWMSMNATVPGEVIFNNEKTDTAHITEILTDASAAMGRKDGNKRIAYIGRKFIGTPYKGGLLDKHPEEEHLTVNIDSLDCTTYVETVMALAYTIGEGRTSWRDFIYNLQRLRYVNGKVDGYASRLHYPSQWIVDNVYRGNFLEVTNVLPNSEYQVKTLDFMTHNRDKYPALADSATFAKMKNAETAYRNHRYPYIKSSKVANKEVLKMLREGDVVLITTKTPGLDVQHMGIIVKENDVPYLMHASSAAGKVTIEKAPLVDYLRKNRTASGIRIVRLND